MILHVVRCVRRVDVARRVSRRGDVGIGHVRNLRRVIGGFDRQRGAHRASTVGRAGRRRFTRVALTGKSDDKGRENARNDLEIRES